MTNWQKYYFLMEYKRGGLFKVVILTMSCVYTAF